MISFASVKIEVNEVEDKDKEEVDEIPEEVEKSSTEVEEAENFDEESGGRFSWKKVFIFTLIAAIIGVIIVGAYLFSQDKYKVTIVKVDHKEKKQRYSEILEMGQRKKYTFYEKFLNQQLNVLFEEEKHGSWSGFTGNYIRVNVKSNKNLHNEVHRVKLLDVQNEGMIGELV